MAVVLDNPPETIAPPNLEQILVRQINQWVDQCHSFRMWYLRNLLDVEPSSENEKLCDQIQPWMIRMTKAFLNQVQDPEFPHPHLAKTLEAVLYQFELDWSTRHMSREEQQAAEALLAKLFPDAS